MLCRELEIISRRKEGASDDRANVTNAANCERTSILKKQFEHATRPLQDVSSDQSAI